MPKRLRAGGLVGTGSRPSIATLPLDGREQRGQHLDGGGLAGAVGPQKGEDFAFGDLEGDVIDGGEIAEFLTNPWARIMNCCDGMSGAAVFVDFVEGGP